MSSASSPRIRILVTGANGFVGRHLTAALAALPDYHEIIAGIYGSKVPEPTRNMRYIQFDVTDSDQVHSIIGAEQPTHLFHLAGIAAPSEAERHIRKAWAVNFEGTLNVALAVAEPNEETFAAVRLFTRCTLQPFLARPDELEAAIERFYSTP